MFTHHADNPTYLSMLSDSELMEEARYCHSASTTSALVIQLAERLQANQRANAQELRDEIDDLEESLSEAQDERDEAEDDLATAQKRIEELEFELSGRDEEIADLEAQIERFAANDTFVPSVAPDQA